MYLISNKKFLNDIILVAPIIEIENNFHGRIQCFATDTILIGDHCILSYPSSLVVLRSDKSSNNTLISIKNYSTINGDIITYDPYQDINKFSLLKIEENTIIKGRVYVYGTIDLKGMLFGSLYTNKIILNTVSSVYENYLLNATIDASQLSKYYVSGYWSESQNKGIIKYLN